MATEEVPIEYKHGWCSGRDFGKRLIACYPELKEKLLAIATMEAGRFLGPAGKKGFTDGVEYFLNKNNKKVSESKKVKL